MDYQIKRHQLINTVMLLAALMGGLTIATSQWTHIFGAADVAESVIYTDALASGWEDWSWDTTSNADNTNPTHSGGKAYAVQHTVAWGGFYLHAEPAVNTASYTHLRFWIHGGPLGGQQIRIVLNGDDAATFAVTAQVNSWTQINVPLTSLGSPATISDIYWQDVEGGAQAVYYLDDIALVDMSGGGQPFPDTTPDRQLDFARSLAGVAVAPSGRLYVSAWRESKIYSWANAQNAANPVANADLILGTAMDPEVACGAQSTTSFCGPEGIAVDANGHLYVAATYEDRVQIFFNPETDADPLEADLTISGFSTPRGVALDSNGNLYVVNEFGAEQGIHIFLDPINTNTTRDFLIQDGIVQALGVAVDGAGNVYVADVQAKNVKRYNSPITTDRLVDQTYSGFDLPHDLALDATGNLYVSDVTDYDHQPPNPPDSTSSRVAVIASPLTSTAVAHAFPNLAYPLGLAFDSTGSLYVAHCVGPYPCNGVGKLLVFNAAPPASPTATATATPTATSTEPGNNAPTATHTPTVTPTVTPTQLPPADITLQVNLAAERKPISEDIYGIHYADNEAFAAEIDLPVRRWGGNSTTRYNWQNNMYGNPDWYFENEHSGVSADDFIAQSQRTGTAPIITMPIIGYVAKDPGQVGNSGTYHCSFDTRVYNYTPQPLLNSDGSVARPATDPDDPARAHCGLGITGYQGNDPTKPIYLTGNNPLDTSIAIGPVWATDWIAHLRQQFGTAANGGVRYYSLDNEPDIWFETHRDVAPNGITLQELRDDGIAYAAAIKAADPDALTLGPVVHGWTYFWHSPSDGQQEAWETRPDRKANGDVPLVPWYLKEMANYEAQNGVRLLDYLDLHYYVQADGVTQADAGDVATQARRLRSTRSLWDPTYVDESWIATAPVSDENGPVADSNVVRLIPRMREWVAGNYPGTKLAITEYNWGALNHINGALAQADVLGIFGREGMDMALLFDSIYSPGGKFTPTGPGAYAFRVYRNYDGQGNKFGAISVQATSTDQDKLSIYAATRPADKAITLVVINKTAEPLMANLFIRNLATEGRALSGTAQHYRYSSANLNAIVKEADQSVGADSFAAAFPANSITMVVLPTIFVAEGEPAPAAQKLYLPFVQR